MHVNHAMWAFIVRSGESEFVIVMSGVFWILVFVADVWVVGVGILFCC